MTRCDAYGGGPGDTWCDREVGHPGMHEARPFPGLYIGWPCFPMPDTDRLKEPLWCVESLWRTFWRLGGWQ